MLLKDQLMGIILFLPCAKPVVWRGGVVLPNVIRSQPVWCSDPAAQRGLHGPAAPAFPELQLKTQTLSPAPDGSVTASCGQAVRRLVHALVCDWSSEAGESAQSTSAYGLVTLGRTLPARGCLSFLLRRLEWH